MKGANMANKKLFKSVSDLVLNRAGGAAYAQSPEAALAQYAVTGTFNGVFYADAGEDFTRVKTLARDVPVQFLAQCAVYAHEAGRMRDVPAFLMAVLLDRDAALFEKAFDRVMTTLRMVRAFVQIVRSGQAGRKSLGSLAKRKVADRLVTASDRELIKAVGQDPSIGDVIKLSRPKPRDAAREALFGYLIGKLVDPEKLPDVLAQLNAFRGDASAEIPAVDFRLLSSADLSPDHWMAIAMDAPWLMTVKNLNTFLRHGVFQDAAMVDRIARRVGDRKLIAKARAFPYQLFAAYGNAYASIPQVIREALIEAAEIATENVPAFEGRVAVFPDVSGSMRAPVTG
jgi:60 kDa SS-A/Ro ribonucleoprotein